MDNKENPFWEGYPFEIKIKARKLDNWDFERVAQKELQYDGGGGRQNSVILMLYT